MKLLWIVPKLILAIFLFSPFVVDAQDVPVRPSVKKTGSYVQPHRRTRPDATKLNNYSTKGNVNPYTGKPGTKDPLKPSRSYRSQGPSRLK